MEVELNPQGTLVERIRAQGSGLGGFLTPTGVGTPIAEGKQTFEQNGRTFILETALQADYAMIRGLKGDTEGNLIFNKSARNFSPLMAMAADCTIAEVEEIMPTGSIDPDEA